MTSARPAENSSEIRMVHLKDFLDLFKKKLRDLSHRLIYKIVIFAAE